MRGSRLLQDPWRAGGRRVFNSVTVHEGQAERQSLRAIRPHTQLAVSVKPYNAIDRPPCLAPRRAHNVRPSPKGAGGKQQLPENVECKLQTSTWATIPHRCFALMRSHHAMPEPR